MAVTEFLEILIRHKQTDDKAFKKLQQKCQKKNYTQEQDNWYISHKKIKQNMSVLLMLTLFKLALHIIVGLLDQTIFLI